MIPACVFRDFPNCPYKIIDKIGQGIILKAQECDLIFMDCSSRLRSLTHASIYTT